MDNTEAIGILRGTTSPASVLHSQIAADMGADALAAWAWVERNALAVEQMDGGYWRVWGPGVGQEGPTPLAAVLDAMAKEVTDAK